jgi:Domain of unknown function (DUF383)/Domain of unknown function (DUF384)
MKQLSTISESRVVENSSTTTTDRTTNNDASSLYKDLLEFLRSPRVDLRLEATKAVLKIVSDRYAKGSLVHYHEESFWGSSSRFLSSHPRIPTSSFIDCDNYRNQVYSLLNHDFLLPMLRIASDQSEAGSQLCAENALKAILYMSSSVEQATNQCIEELMNHKAVPRLIEVVMTTHISSSVENPQQKGKLVNLALGILANLTRTEVGAVELAGKTLPDEAVKEINSDQAIQEKPIMALLLDRFLSRDFICGRADFESIPSHDWDTLSDDPYQHFAAILMNVTQVESGRQFVLRIPQAKSSKDQQPKSVFEILLSQLRTPNPVRRRGISGMIRNCCLDKEAAWWMINVAKMLTPVLYPLAGPEELDWDEKQGMDPDLWLEGPDKTREIDEATRQNLVDCILLLCASGRQARNSLRLARTYVILKYADMVEESEAVSEGINECVQFLRRDEEGTEEGSSDRLVEKEYTPGTKLKLLPSSQVSYGENYDDVD